MDIFNLALGMLGTNCYILCAPDEPGCIIIDPADEPRYIFNRLDDLKVEPKYIVITHGHPDHLGAVAALKEAYPEVQIMIHEADAKIPPQFGRGAHTPAGAADWPSTVTFLRDGDKIQCGSICLDVYHTPGHSPGGVCLYAKEDGCVFTGDTLFNGSVGRSDFPGGNIHDLEASIRNKLYRLPPDTVVYPGHSQSTSIGDEMQFKPFFRGDPADGDL